MAVFKELSNNEIAAR